MKAEKKKEKAKSIARQMARENLVQSVKDNMVDLVEICCMLEAEDGEGKGLGLFAEVIGIVTPTLENQEILNQITRAGKLYRLKPPS